jgi:hypothetical protein
MVFIYSPSSPFTTYFPEGGVPYIGLSCRSDEPMNDAAMRRAAAEAVHEAVHVFNFTERPHNGIWANWWAWFDEALAVHLESRVLLGNQDYFRYLANWMDLPGVPLNQWGAHYQACLFVHYLSARLGPLFPNQVWMESRENEKPLEAIRRLLHDRGVVFASADPDHRDLFSSYSIDCYFLRDHESGCFAPELCTRYGDRAVAASGRISRGETIEFEAELPHLACNYFRVYPHRGVDGLRVVLHPGEGTATALKAELAVASPDFHRGHSAVLRSGGDPDGRRSVELADLANQDLHHVVLVVTNCHLEEVSRYRGPRYRGESFRIEVTAA